MIIDFNRVKKKIYSIKWKHYLFSYHKDPFLTCRHFSSIGFDVMLLVHVIHFDFRGTNWHKTTLAERLCGNLDKGWIFIAIVASFTIIFRMTDTFVRTGDDLGSVWTVIFLLLLNYNGVRSTVLPFFHFFR